METVEVADEPMMTDVYSSPVYDNETTYADETTFIHISTAILSLTMITAFLGNIFLAFIIVHTTNRKMGPVQILILHTCLADIMFALCSVVPQLARFLTAPIFFGNDLLCRAVSFVQIVPMYASSYLLVAISIDRYVAICKPIAARNWKYKRVYLLAGLAWFTSFLFSVPQIFFFRYDDAAQSCVSHFPDTENTAIMSTMEKWYIAWFLVAAWLIPSVVIGVLYTLLCWAVYRSDRSVHRLGAILLTAGTTATSTGDQWRNELRRCQPAAERSTRAKMLKTIKLTLTIVVCNFVLWSPFCLTNFITAVFPDAIDPYTSTYILLVGNLNSCVNPWIYLAFNHKDVCKSGGGRHSEIRQIATPRFSRYTAVPIALTVHAILRRQSSLASTGSNLHDD